MPLSRDFKRARSHSSPVLLRKRRSPRDLRPSSRPSRLSPRLDHGAAVSSSGCLIEAEAAGDGLEPGPQIALEMLRTESEFLADLIRTMQLIHMAEALELTGTPNNS